MEEENSGVQVEMPNVTGLSVKEAKIVLKELGLELEIEGEEMQETIIQEQLPQKGIQIKKGTKIIVYTQ